MESKFTTIFVFGASNSYGAWDNEGGWVSRLRRFLDTEKRRGYENFYFIYNLGISGNTSENLLKRFEFETKQRLEPDSNRTIFIFDIGKNDAAFIKSKKSNWIAIDKFKENISKLIELSGKFSPNVFFLEMVADIDELLANPWDDDLSYYIKDLKAYNEALKNVCIENNAAFVDISGELSKLGNGFLSEDGLHLNSLGHQKTFEIIKNSLIKGGII